jgi:prolyl-tRNA synthetase
VLKHPDGTREPLAIGLPGDREVDQKRLEGQLEPIEVEPMDEAEMRKHPTLVKGYIGPGTLGEKGTSGIRYVVDPRISEGTAWVTGANVDGSHVLDLVVGRDFTPDGTIEAADVRAGDPCPSCGAALAIRRGIELGHIFQLGRRFADAFELDALGPDSRPIRITMGSYGIGLSRLVAVIAETYADEHGLVWPREIAPYDVHVLAAGKGQLDAAAALAADLERAGLRILVDDRPGLSAGVRFADAELLGAPTTVVVGRRFAEGAVEVRDRASGARDDVELTRLVAKLAG